MTSCGRARRELFVNDGPRIATPSRHEAEAHLESCAACRAFFAEQEQIRSMLRATLPRVAAPVETRNRLFTTIARARTQSAPAHRRRGPGGTVAGAIAAAAVIVTLALRAMVPSDPAVGPDVALVDALAEDHGRTGTAGIRSDDAATVDRWLAERLPFPIHVPVFEEAPLRGARIGMMSGRVGAVIEYEAQGEVVSYFIVPFDREAAPGLAEPGLHHQARSGYRMAMWPEAGLMHALVGGVPREQLERLARLCVEQARDPHRARS